MTGGVVKMVSMSVVDIVEEGSERAMQKAITMQNSLAS